MAHARVQINDLFFRQAHQLHMDLTTQCKPNEAEIEARSGQKDGAQLHDDGVELRPAHACACDQNATQAHGRIDSYNLPSESRQEPSRKLFDWKQRR